MNSNPDISILISNRFKKKYEKASISLQGLAEGAIHDFVRSYRSNRKTILFKYDRIAHIKTPLLEIDISGGHRIIAQLKRNNLHLLDIGGHDIVNRYDLTKFNVDILRINSAPKQFFPEYQSKLFIGYPDRSVDLKYSEEIYPEWIYFLEDEQYKVLEDIFDSILSGGKQIHFILGGPGTGKSCILLNLLKIFIDGEINTGLVMSDSLISYIEKSTNTTISTYCVDLYNHDPLEVMLIDDPQNLKQSINWPEARSNVIAFDPLQLPRDLTDEELDDLLAKRKIKTHELTDCYRQKENVGIETKNIVDIIAKSTPFLRKDKIINFNNKRKKITKLSNDLNFINPHGYTKIYRNANSSDVEFEVDRILQYKYLMWNHCPGLLFLFLGGNLTEEMINPIFSSISSSYVKSLFLGSDIESIKGLEFQHVFIFMDHQQLDELELGFKGSGQKTYHERRLLRIPFSRAKDSLVVFVFDNKI
jgi:hypothetical protein